jgi:uncharacterized protein (DUF2147 family)
MSLSIRDPRTLRRACLALAAGAFLLPAQAALAFSPLGIWLTEKKDARIEVADCGGALCGSIVWMINPNDPKTGRPQLDTNNPEASRRQDPVLGLRIITGMKPNGTNEWTGQVYNPDDGKTYKANMIMKGEDKLRLEGCMLFICMGELWTRSQLPAPNVPPALPAPRPTTVAAQPPATNP